MSGSAVLPPKRPPRSPLKLQLPGTAPAPPAEPNGGRPKLSLNPAPPPNPNGRPSLKLPGLTAGLAGLSLAIPQQGVSRYSSGLDRGNLNDDDDELESDSDGDGSAGHGLWAAGEQERMAGELLEVINGAPAGELEDELSGRTRRPRSNSRFVPRRPSFNNSGTTQADSAQGNGAGSAHLLSPPVLNTVTVPAAPPPTPPPRAPPPPPSAPQLNFYGDHVRAALQSTSSLHSQASTPLDTPRRPASPVPLASSRRPSHDSHGFGVAEPVESDDDHFDDERDGKLDISPQTIKDLGRLGEGASGEVRKVLHIPSQIIMAKKVGPSAVDARLWSFADACCARADDHDLAESQSAQAAPPRAPVHARLHAPQHRPILRRLPRVGTRGTVLECEGAPRLTCGSGGARRTTPRSEFAWSLPRRVASSACTKKCSRRGIGPARRCSARLPNQYVLSCANTWAPADHLFRRGTTDIGGTRLFAQPEDHPSRYATDHMLPATYLH